MPPRRSAASLDRAARLEADSARRFEPFVIWAQVGACRRDREAARTSCPVPAFRAPAQRSGRSRAEPRSARAVGSEEPASIAGRTATCGSPQTHGCHRCSAARLLLGEHAASPASPRSSRPLPTIRAVRRGVALGARASGIEEARTSRPSRTQLVSLCPQAQSPSKPPSDYVPAPICRRRVARSK
jgi:hypothetical protein